MEKQQTNTPSPTQPLLPPPSYLSPVYPPNNNVDYNNNVEYNHNYYTNYKSNYTYNTYTQPPNNNIVYLGLCAFHPQIQAIRRCHSCTKLLCLQCAVEVGRRERDSHFFRTTKWVSHFFCPACAIKVRSNRRIVLVVSFVIFLVLLVSGIMVIIRAV